MRRGALFFLLQAGRDELRRGGPRRLWAAIRYRLSPLARRRRARLRDDALAFDRAGYETGGILYLDDVAIVGGGGPGDGGAYEATPTYVFEAALAILDIALDDATFIDLGAGKGRTLLLAAERPFARIVGVEYAEPLIAVAAANLARHAERSGPRPRILLHAGDAAGFAFPPGPLVVFLYNPFGAATMRAVAAALHASWQADPRPIRLLYLNPRQEAEVLAAGFRLSARSPDYAIRCYAPVAAGEAGDDAVS